MISVDDGVIPCGRGMGCSLTAPSPRIQAGRKTLLENSLFVYVSFNPALFFGFN